MPAIIYYFSEQYIIGNRLHQPAWFTMRHTGMPGPNNIESQQRIWDRIP